MIDKLDDLKEFLRNINISEINFVPYFYAKKEERPYLTDDLVREKIKDVDDILGFRKHFVRGKERYRLAIRLSGKYTLVIVIEIKEKGLNIITAWKTSRKWQKSIQK